MSDDGKAQSMTTIAVWNADGATFTITRGAWTSTYPLAELPKWIAFYRREAGSVAGQKSYVEDLQALEWLQREISEYA